MREMTELPDLQDEVRKTLEAFASICDGRLNGEVFDCFIAIAANVLNAAAVMLDADDADHPNCALCRAVECASDAAHALARIADTAKEGSGESARVH
jgi:hypothetical protein